MLFELGKAYKEIVNNKKKAEKLILQAIELIDDYDLQDKMYKEIGYVQYCIPSNEDWDTIIRLNICEEKLEELYSKEGQYVLPKECTKLKQIEREILEEYFKLKKDSFKCEMYKVKSRLKCDPFFTREDFEFIDAKPYTLIFQKDEELSPGFLKKVEEQKSVLAQYWKQIKKNWIDRLKLKSNLPNDTKETPKPLTLVCLKDRNEFDRYLKLIDKKIPSFARAYYSRITKFVVFYQDTAPNNTEYFKISVIIHEITEQILDRYATAEHGLRDMKSHFITQGFAEYMTGHEIDEKTKEYKFASIKYKARMQMFGFLKRVYGNHVSYVYDNLKDNKEMPFLPPKEDWNVVPIECLITGRSASFVMYYGKLLGQMYRTGFLKGAQRENDAKKKNLLMRRAIILSQALGNPGEFIHA